MSRWPGLAAWLLVALASVRIATTYRELSFTIDEPGHFACGLEYLTKHVYRYETQHPPLARAAIALLPYLAGVRPQNDPNRNVEGRLVMLRSGNLERTLVLMRLGILPFFWLACWIVFLWARRYYDPWTAGAAVGLFTLLPPVLAHAGLACTDMALAAGVGAAFYALLVWAESPDRRHAIVLGAAGALAVLTKFTALVYLPAVAGFALLFHWRTVRRSFRRAHLTSFAFALATGAAVIWAAYWFSFAKVPAPEFFDGLLAAQSHDKGGHPAYLLGHYSLNGWWYYFPVVLAVKTPLAFLILAAIGCANRLALAYCLGILIPAMAGHVDIGVRLILPVYIALSIMAAVALRRLLRGRAVAFAIPLLAWLVTTGVARHPDYLRYFNELAGPDPSKVLVDSDLDWGQDTQRLAARLRALGAREVSLMLIEPLTWPLPVEADLRDYYGLPRILPADAQFQHEGWTAISPTVARTLQLPFQAWYDRVPPTEGIGALWLYRMPPKP